MKKDLFFKVSGDKIQTDHSFHLFSALSKLFPNIHNDLEIGISRIDGKLLPNRMTEITDKSRLRLRLPVEVIPDLLVSIQNKDIEISGNKLSIGTLDKVSEIKYCRQLYSRIVTIRNKKSPQDFYLEAENILEKIGLKNIQLGLKLPDGDSPVFRPSNDSAEKTLRTRTVNIKGYEAVGYGVVIGGLNKEQSIKLQEKGLGGRRHFGCGIFVPWKNYEKKQ